MHTQIVGCIEEKPANANVVRRMSYINLLLCQLSQKSTCAPDLQTARLYFSSYTASDTKSTFVDETHHRRNVAFAGEDLDKRRRFAIDFASRVFQCAAAISRAK